MSESSPGRILDCDSQETTRVAIPFKESESSPGRILDCDFLRRSESCRPYPGLNHLQGEYWIATFLPRVTRFNYLLRSESSPGRILDCDSGTNHPTFDQFDVWIISRANTGLRPISVVILIMTSLSFCLNHLQGEYWIATVLLTYYFVVAEKYFNRL